MELSGGLYDQILPDKTRVHYVNMNPTKEEWKQMWDDFFETMRNQPPRKPSMPAGVLLVISDETFKDVWANGDKYEIDPCGSEMFGKIMERAEKLGLCTK